MRGFFWFPYLASRTLFSSVVEDEVSFGGHSVRFSQSPQLQELSSGHDPWITTKLGTRVRRCHDVEEDRQDEHVYCYEC